MKLKFILPLTIAALAVATTMSANAADTVTNGPGALNQGNGYFGFATNLTSSQVTANPSPVAPIFDIDTITLTGRPSSGTYTSMKLAVYTYTADGTVGTFEGLSDAQTLANSTSRNFTFSGGLNVTSANTYQYLFVTAATTSTDLNGSTLASYQAHSVSSSLSLSNNTALSPGSGTYEANTLNSWQGNFLPQFTFAAVAVPEPSTLVLAGIFGLGMLMLFRRRRA